MRIIELETRNWRGLTRKIGPLSPNLNLISARNEAGKSRLCEAMQFAIAESYKGGAEHKKALKSWLGGDEPLVRLTFEADGQEYTIEKQFLARGYARLSGGGKTLQNEDAEAALRTLLGHRASGSVRVKPEDFGIWPLLLVNQGSSRMPASDALNEDARGRLQQKLSGHIGEVSISDAGMKLLERARAEYLRFYTENRGSETGPLAAARQALRTATERLEAAQRAQAQQVKTATELADARKDLESLKLRVHDARAQAEAAQARADAVRDASSQMTTAEERAAAAKAKAENEAKAVEQREQTLERLEKQRADLASLEAELANRVAEEERLAAAARACDATMRAAQARVDEARKTLDLVRRKASHARLLEEIKRVEATHRAMVENQARLDAARSRQSTLREISEATLTQLRELDRKHQMQAAQLRGAAVKVVVTARQDLEVDGQPAKAGETVSIEVVDDRSIQLGALAEIEVRPGSGDLVALRRNADAAERAFRAALAETGHESLEAATAAESNWRDCVQQIAGLERERQATSSKTLGDLAAELERLRQEAAANAGEIAIAIDEMAASAQAAEAETDLRLATGHAADAAAALSEYQNATAGQKGRREAIQQQLHAEEALEAGRPTLDAVKAAQQQADDLLATLRREAAEAKAQFNNLGGKTAQDDAKRLAAAHRGLQDRMAETRSQVDRLTGSLGEMMATGHYEEVSSAENALTLATTAMTRIERQAKAAERLYTVLNEERSRVVERLTAPVIARIRPYLEHLFPGSSLLTDESLTLQGRLTNNVEEHFDALSGGAQEQLSVMVRIGIAEVLADGGRLPLVLDDAFTNTDEQRMALVHRALNLAAQKLQIIVFSCHEQLFDGLGADFFLKLPANA